MSLPTYYPYPHYPYLTDHLELRPGHLEWTVKSVQSEYLQSLILWNSVVVCIIKHSSVSEMHSYATAAQRRILLLRIPVQKLRIAKPHSNVPQSSNLASCLCIITHCRQITLMVGELHNAWWCELLPRWFIACKIIMQFHALSVGSYAKSPPS